MSEYNDVIKQFKRMCWYYSRDKVQKSCPMCTSYPNCNIGQCRKIAFEQPAHFAATVMRWAKEHPEPVYPMWLEWLEKMGIMADIHDRLNNYKQVMEVCGKPLYSIPTTKVFCPHPRRHRGEAGVAAEGGIA